MGSSAPHGRSGRTRADRGVALVEFAVALPLLAVLVFGTLDLGRAYSLWNETKNAAREGAAYAIDRPCDTAGITEAATTETDRAVTVTVELPPGRTCPAGTSGSALRPGEQVVVRVETPYALITPLLSGFVSDVDVAADVEVTVL
jgi:hypothetical protein